MLVRVLLRKQADFTMKIHFMNIVIMVINSSQIEFEMRQKFFDRFVYQ